MTTRSVAKSVLEVPTTFASALAHGSIAVDDSFACLILDVALYDRAATRSWLLAGDLVFFLRQQFERTTDLRMRWTDLFVGQCHRQHLSPAKQVGVQVVNYLTTQRELVESRRHLSVAAGADRCETLNGSGPLLT